MFLLPLAELVTKIGSSHHNYIKKAALPLNSWAVFCWRLGAFLKAGYVRSLPKESQSPNPNSLLHIQQYSNILIYNL